MTKGFCGWKDATVAFKRHYQSKAHSEAVEVMVTLPKSTKDVGELLDKAHKKEKEEATVMLLHILSSVCFLARQGLALRGDGSDESSNLNNLMILHYHQDLCDKIDMRIIANEYIVKSEARKNTFSILNLQ